MTSLRTLVIVLGLAACGSSHGQPTNPTGATTGASLELGEITIADGSLPMMAAHANGDVDVALKAGTLTKVGTLTADGTFTSLKDGKHATLGADGKMMTPDGVAPFTLVGTTLATEDVHITIDHGKIVGGKPEAASVVITGADTDGKKRTALLMLAMLMVTSSHGPGPAAVTVPATPAP